MATDYFTMMKDVVGGYGKGVDIARSRAYEDEKRARETTEYDQRQTEYQRKLGMQKEEDTAVQNYGVLTSQGKRNQTGIDANNADFEQAVQATGQGLAMPTQAPQQPEWAPATDVDKNQGLQAISRARRDWNGVASLQKEEKALNLDAGRKTEYQRLSALAPEKLAELVGSEFSKDGSGVDAMLTYDPKANKYLFASNVPGMPSQSLSRTELLNHAIGIWETGNGDFNAGLQNVMSTMKAQREINKNNFDRSAKIAEGDAGLHYKGLEASDRRTKMANDRAYQQGSLGLRRQEISGRGDGKAVSPETTKLINDLVVRYQNSTDPKERASLEREFNVLQGQAATQLGKPMQLRTENSGRAAPPLSKIEEAGTGYRDNETGGIKYADGRGGFIAEGGVMPADRGGALKKAGLPDNLLGQLPWNADGTAVGFGGQAYNVNDPTDMRALAQDYARLSRNEISATEARKQEYHVDTAKGRRPTSGTGGEIYYRDGVEMPTQAQWDTYNAKQR